MRSSKVRGSTLAFIYSFIYLSHFKPLPFRKTRPWSQGINPSLPGTRLVFWSRGLGQHSRTASTHTKQTQSTTLFTHVITLSTVEIIHCEEKTQRSGIRTIDIYPNGENQIIRPPGRGGFEYIPNTHDSYWSGIPACCRGLVGLASSHHVVVVAYGPCCKPPPAETLDKRSKRQP